MEDTFEQRLVDALLTAEEMLRNGDFKNGVEHNGVDEGEVLIWNWYARDIRPVLEEIKEKYKPQKIKVPSKAEVMCSPAVTAVQKLKPKKDDTIVATLDVSDICPTLVDDHMRELLDILSTAFDVSAILILPSNVKVVEDFEGCEDCPFYNKEKEDNVAAK